MGNLVAMVERRTEVFNFEYDLDWLRSSPVRFLTRNSATLPVISIQPRQGLISGCSSTLLLTDGEGCSWTDGKPRLLAKREG